MTVTKHPTTTQKTTLQSTEGLDLDLWQSFDLKNFLPKALQELINEVVKLLDKIQAVLEFALAAAKKAAAAVSTLFDFLRNILNAIREAILSMLDLFPLLETGVYFLYIPIGYGGNNYYLNTFKKSLTDSNDRRRPPDDDRLIMHAMFVMAGSTWISQNKMDTAVNLWQTVSTIKNLFNTGDSTNAIGVDPPRVLNFKIEYGFFSQEKVTTSTVTNSVKVPTQNLGLASTSINQANTYIRTSIQKIDKVIPANKSGDSYNLSWKLPNQFRRPLYETVSYATNHRPDQYEYEFIKTTRKIHGVYIIRSTELDILQQAIIDFPKTSFTTIKHFPTETTTDSQITSLGTATVITYPLTVKDQLTSTQWYLDNPSDSDTQQYYYSIAVAYSTHKQMRAATPNTSGGYDIKNFYQLNAQTVENMDNPNNTEEIISILDFSKISPRDVDFKNIKDENLEEALVLSGEFTRPKKKSANTSPSSSQQPDWVSFALLRDLFPQIKEVIEKTRAMVNNIIDGLLDDLTAFENYVKAQIAKIENILKDAIDFIKKLKSLLFPPMAGIYYLQAESSQGTPGLVRRLEESLEHALLPSTTAYHPALLDVDYQTQNPEEYNRRKNIPAYTVNDLATGFVLLFQEPQLKRFFQDLWDIPTKGLVNEFQKIYDESKRNFKEYLKLPEMKYPLVVKHEMEKPSQQSSNPSEYMNILSNYKKGIETQDQEVNDEGNVETKASNTGPYTFISPTNLSIAVEEDQYQSVVIPSGNLTNEAIVDIINNGVVSTTTQPKIANTVSDGSFMLEAKHLQISSCSFEAAAILGLTVPLNISAPETPVFTTDQFNYSAGDYLVEISAEGPPTLDMLGATPPIFQLLPADLTNATNSPTKFALGPDACYIKIQVETDNSPVIVDVTGNQGNNPQNKSAYWELTATYPLEVTDNNNKLDIQLTTTQSIKTKYNTFTEWNTELQSLTTALEGRTHTPVNLTQTLNKATPLVDTKQSITLQPGTYATPQDLMRALLDTLHGGPELDDNNNQVKPRFYPVGLLKTETDSDPIATSGDNKTFKSRLLFEDTNAHNQDNKVEVTQSSSNPIHLNVKVDQSQTANHLGVTKVDYTLTQVVNNLNSAIPPLASSTPYFSNEGGTIRITGTKTGVGNIIKVFCSMDEENETYSKHYYKVASALFGVSQQSYDLEVEGIGDPLTTKMYNVELESIQHCINFDNNYLNLYKVDLDNILEYNVEIENSEQLSYTLEL